VAEEEDRRWRHRRGDSAEDGGGRRPLWPLLPPCTRPAGLLQGWLSKERN
jgi:hypothetical protein